MSSDIKQAMGLAAMGMKAQGTRMRVISENMANSETTASEAGGDPYRRQLVTFKNIMNRRTDTSEVKVDRIIGDQSDFRMKYDPSHPSADDKGYIKLPNVNSMVEMMDMREAQRSYEANLGVIDMSRTMLMRTIDLLRS